MRFLLYNKPVDSFKGAIAVEIREPKDNSEFEAYYDLRWRILRKPWGQERGSEKDELEEEAFHVIAVDNGRIIGGGRGHGLGRLLCARAYTARDLARDQKRAAEGYCEKLTMSMHVRLP